MTVSQLGLDFLPWTYRFLVTVSQLGLDFYLGLIGFW